ncbi:unnamed protein product, partial [Gadus morhua 'NCC']
FRPDSITATTRPISPSKAVLLVLICSNKLLVTTLEASRDWRWRSSDLSSGISQAGNSPVIPAEQSCEHWSLWVLDKCSDPSTASVDQPNIA